MRRHPLYTLGDPARACPRSPTSPRSRRCTTRSSTARGYPWRSTAAAWTCRRACSRSPTSYEALTADRPYRAGMTPDEALGILRREAEAKLCRDAVGGLKALLLL